MPVDQLSPRLPAMRLHMKLVRRLKRESYLSDRGSIESAMVIVPLMILFLAGMQIAVASHSRNIEKMKAQDSASVRAISGDFVANDQFIHINSSGDGQNLDLIISHRDRSVISLLPNLASILGRSPRISVDGIAIVENSR